MKLPIPAQRGTPEYERIKHARAWPRQRERVLAKRAEKRATDPGVRAYFREYQRTRRAGDHVYALQDRVRGLTLAAFKRGGYTKGARKTIDILGCEWETLKAHIESQFAPGMTWENRGDWEIDHRLPLALAMSESDVVELGHYKNLQPLWRLDNKMKADKC